MRRVFVLAVLFALVLAFAGNAGASSVTLKVGATPVPHAEILDYVKPLLAAQGINLEVVEFTDYVQPNLALAAGDLDANFFQHVPYLDSFKNDHRLDLTAIARVHVEPMGLYSQKVRSLRSLPSGAIVAIPNDPTNGGRALLLLQSQRLITLRKGAGLKATVLDVAKNPRKLVIKELEAAQLPRSLPDVGAAVINGNYALQAGLNPLKDALALEGADSPYVNVLVARTQDAKKPALIALAKALTSKEVKKFILSSYGGAVVPAF